MDSELNRAVAAMGDKHATLPVTNAADTQYLAILAKLLNKGVYREGRNGGTYGLFGEQMRFNLADGFPLLTTKKVHFKSIVVELLWMLRGYTNTSYLEDHGVTIWREWENENGDLGPVYGENWRSFPNSKHVPYSQERLPPVDQIMNVIHSIKTDPFSRRHIVSAWNPATVDDAALPPCHTLFQFHVAEGRLSCHLYQRSADWFLGTPFNIASYALLTHIIARETSLIPGDFVHSFGDLHLYKNHIEAAGVQLSRQWDQHALPKIDIDPPGALRWVNFESLEPSHIKLIDYNPHPTIKADVSK